jgi:hypothetical protein
MSHIEGEDQAQPPSDLAGMRKEGAGLPRGFTITDGKGGVLSLDLASPNLDAFAEACRLLAKGPLPSGASVLVVRLEHEDYVLTYCDGALGAGEIQIASLNDPLWRVRLSPELAEVVAALVEESAHRQRP